MLITVILLVAFSLGLVFEILHLRRMYNYRIDQYDGLVDLSNDLVDDANTLSKDYGEALREHVDLLMLTEQLLCLNSEEEVKKIADKIYVLIETGVSRKYEEKDNG